MFNGDLKKKALKKLQKSNETYQKTAAQVTLQASELHELRINTSVQIIRDVESYINTLANSPKEFEKAVSELKISYKKFEAIIDDIIKSDNTAKVAGSSAGAGVVAGAGVATLAPGAAMAIATTFGTASTGTAISALSGAAATNAALAWLGGGALAAGGGGMAAGNALLALAGPIGWGIGGAAIVGGAIWARKKNKNLAEKANKETGRIQRENGRLKEIGVRVSTLHSQTENHSNKVNQHLAYLRSSAPNNYRSFSREQKQEIGSLVHNINSLSELLVKSVN